jgi:hypothetical protein
MSCVILREDEVRELLALKNLPADVRRRILAVANIDKLSVETRHAGIREMAFDAYHRDGELEIDDVAIVSEGDDNGAYVMSWRWVSFEGTPLDKKYDEVSRLVKAVRSVSTSAMDAPRTSRRALVSNRSLDELRSAKCCNFLEEVPEDLIDGFLASAEASKRKDGKSFVSRKLLDTVIDRVREIRRELRRPSRVSGR